MFYSLMPPFSPKQKRGAREIPLQEGKNAGVNSFFLHLKKLRSAE